MRFRGRYEITITSMPGSLQPLCRAQHFKDGYFCIRFISLEKTTASVVSIHFRTDTS